VRAISLQEALCGKEDSSGSVDVLTVNTSHNR
jgi:hypothetical protein